MGFPGYDRPQHTDNDESEPDYYITDNSPDSTKGNASAYTFDNYQEDAGATAIYPNYGDGGLAQLNYVILGLVGEAGEIANKFKKLYRDNPKDIDRFFSDLDDEVGDVLWYIANYAIERGKALGDLAADNIRKLNDRKQRDSLKGSGDDR